MRRENVCYEKLAGVLAYIFAGLWSVIWLPIIIFISHVLLDGLKSKRKDSVQFFLLDQLGHFIVILACWMLLVNANITDIFTSLISGISKIKLWILIIAYILVIWPAGVLIGKITKPWRDEIKGTSSRGLDKAGFWRDSFSGCAKRGGILLDRYND
jgi:hypothetical protein